MSVRPSISDDLAERIDAIRGDVPRDRWISRALEGPVAMAEAGAAQLGEGPGSLGAGHSPALSPAPRRAESRPSKPFKPIPKK